jgi:Uma2 family endonuclease
MQAELQTELEGPMTEAEYLAFEAASPLKHEYVLGWVRVHALAGALENHNLIAMNLSGEFWLASRKKGCRTYGSDMRLRVSGELSYYPDVTVVCDPGDADPRHKTRPCVLVEVLSPGTAAIDRGEKLLAYRGIESLQTYLIVSSVERRVERHWRDEQGAWHRADLFGNGTLAIPCLDLQLSLEAIYAGINVELAGANGPS